MRVDVEENREAFAAAGARAFVEAANEAIAERGKFVVALTGGSTPVPIHQALAGAFRDRVLWEKVEVLFGDERAVAPDDPLSNYRAARESLLSHVPATVHRMEAERKDLESAAREYAAKIDQIDLMFVGIGKDAHILSLFPGSPAIDAKELVVASIDPPMNPAVSRLTMTPAVFSRTKRIIAIANGAEKREAVEKMLTGALDVKNVPAQLLRDLSDVRLIVDRAASM
jgi:6-phosphogluconolactonase